MNNIFVGNLSFQATKEDLVKLFEPFGSVANAVIMERKKRKSRGFGFVDMPNEEEKNAAISALEGKEFMGRVLSVSVVIPKVKGERKPKSFKPAKKEWKLSEGQSTFKGTGESKPFHKGDRGSKSWVKSQSATKSPRGDFREAKPWLKNKSNAKPFRREERESRSESGGEGAKKPYKKFDPTSKPWDKKEGGSKPYRREEWSSRSESGSEGAKKPYKKFDGQSKPWVKKEGGSKPFRKDEGRSKLGGQSKPWDKKKSGPKPFKRPDGGFKMSHKVSGIPKSWSKNKERAV